MLRLDRIVDGLPEIAAGLEVREYDGRDAARLAEVAADVERLGGTIKVLFARRAAETRGRARDTYKILGNACPEHHDRITYDGYTVEINDDGSWTLRAPPHTDAA